MATKAKTKRAAKRPNRIEVFIGDDGLGYFHVKSANGRIVDDGGQGFAGGLWGAKRAACRAHPGLAVSQV